jgi:hypothetical protein
MAEIIIYLGRGGGKKTVTDQNSIHDVIKG